MLALIVILIGIITIIHIPGNKAFIFWVYSIIAINLYLKAYEQDYWNLNLGEGLSVILWYVIFVIIIFCILGVLSWRYFNTPDQLSWQKSDNIFIVALLIISITYYGLNYSGICLAEGKKYSDFSILKKYLDEGSESDLAVYYRNSSNLTNALGARRVRVQSITIKSPNKEDDRYATETFFSLDACGNRVGDLMSMGMSKRAVEIALDSQKYIVK